MALIKPKNSAIVKVEPTTANPLTIKLTYSINPSQRIQKYSEVASLTNKEISQADYAQTILSFLNTRGQASTPASATKYTALRYVPVSKKTQAFEINM